MNTNLQNNTETIRDTTGEAAVPTTVSGELAVILEMLASVGLSAGAIFDGDADSCPHCLSQVLSEAA